DFRSSSRPQYPSAACWWRPHLRIFNCSSVRLARAHQRTSHPAKASRRLSRVRSLRPRGAPLFPSLAPPFSHCSAACSSEAPWFITDGIAAGNPSHGGRGTLTSRRRPHRTVAAQLVALTLRLVRQDEGLRATAEGTSEAARQRNLLLDER